MIQQLRLSFISNTVIVTYHVIVHYTKNNSTSFSVFIAAGESYGAVDACSQGQYFSTGAVICGTCVVDSDNPNINLGQFGC